MFSLKNSVKYNLKDKHADPDGGGNPRLKSGGSSPRTHLAPLSPGSSVLPKTFLCQPGEGTKGFGKTAGPRVIRPVGHVTSAGKELQQGPAPVQAAEASSLLTIFVALDNYKILLP